MSLRVSILAAAVLALTATWAPAADAPMTRAAVEEALTCQCGCGLTVHACNHLQCSFAIPVRKDIAESLDRGETGEQILARYREKYGEKVLSSPVPTGFNILAWVGPYIALALGAIFILVAIRRMAASPPSGRAVAEPGDGISHDDPVEAARRARLKAEVKELER